MRGKLEGGGEPIGGAERCGKLDGKGSEDDRRGSGESIKGP